MRSRVVCFLGRFLPKLGGAARHRHFFSRPSAPRGPHSIRNLSVIGCHSFAKRFFIPNLGAKVSQFRSVSRRSGRRPNNRERTMKIAHTAIARTTIARTGRAALAAALLLSLAACGYRPGDRAASGALIGAGGGAAVAALTGGAPLVGAAIGAGAGAIGGAVTSPHDINLGRPIWH
jgi:hypothetical protein